MTVAQKLIPVEVRNRDARVRLSHLLIALGSILQSRSVCRWSEARFLSSNFKFHPFFCQTYMNVHVKTLAIAAAKKKERDERERKE